MGSVWKLKSNLVLVCKGKSRPSAASIVSLPICEHPLLVWLSKSNHKLFRNKHIDSLIKQIFAKLENICQPELRSLHTFQMMKTDDVQAKLWWKFLFCRFIEHLFCARYYSKPKSKSYVVNTLLQPTSSLKFSYISIFWNLEPSNNNFSIRNKNTGQQTTPTSWEKHLCILCR